MPTSLLLSLVLFWNVLPLLYHRLEQPEMIHQQQLNKRLLILHPHVLVMTRDRLLNVLIADPVHLQQAGHLPLQLCVPLDQHQDRLVDGLDERQAFGQSGQVWGVVLLLLLSGLCVLLSLNLFLLLLD